MNITGIKENNINEYIYNLWSTDTFKELHKNNLFIKKLIKKLEIAPIFVYKTTNEKQKNHLTSFFRLLSLREYDNKYIQDLYYLHELSHMAQYNPEENITYENWKNKINDNELYASIVSEVLVYFFDKELHKKTFNPLWANIFIHDIFNNSNQIQNKYGFFYDKTKEKDVEWNNKLEKNEIDLFSTKKENWNLNIGYIFKRRQQLRYELNENSALKSELIIVNYNEKREKWLDRWTSYYKDIDKNLINLTKNKNINEYINLLLSNKNEDDIIYPIDAINKKNKIK